jgi:hypothetical protein
MINVKLPTPEIAKAASVPTPTEECDICAASDNPFEIAEISITNKPPKVYQCPFRIVACTNEGAPYHFVGMRTNKSDGDLPIIAEVIRKPLYLMSRKTIEVKGKSFLKGLADYSIDGLEEEIQIERKSKDDLFGTLGGRRDDFEAEIARIGECKYAAVVIEAEWSEIFQDPPSRSRLPPKVVRSTVQSWSKRYPRVHWFTLPGRQAAEEFVFQELEMFWRQRQHG